MNPAGTSLAVIAYPNVDPVIVQFGPFAVRWYAVAYIVGLLFASWYMKRLVGNPRLWGGQKPSMTAPQVDDFFIWSVLGVVLGGRLGYVLFYKPMEYLAHPLNIFKIWEGGMSFHGGFLGVILAMALFAHRHKLRWLAVTDFIAPLVPLGLAAGRLGNFINGELWGRATDLPWGMVFPQAGDGIARHHSQLYQFAGEGLLLFLILWLYSSKPRPMGAISGVFLIGYGSFRFLAEFAREPDSFLGLLGLGLSMGQWLSLPMVVAGVGMLRWALQQSRPH